VKFTDKKIKWAVKQVINKDESTAVVAARYGVSRRRIQQLARRYKETGEYLVLDAKRRLRILLSAEEERISHGLTMLLKSSNIAIRSLYIRPISYRKIGG
jgi:transposase